MLFASAAALGFNAPSAMRPMGRTCAPTMGEAEDLQLLVSRFGPTSQEQQHSRRSALQATSCGLCSGRGARSRRPSAYRGAPTPGGRRRRRTVWPTACQLGVPRAFPRPSATRAAAERTCAPSARGPPPRAGAWLGARRDADPPRAARALARTSGGTTFEHTNGTRLLYVSSKQYTHTVTHTRSTYGAHMARVSPPGSLTVDTEKRLR